MIFIVGINKICSDLDSAMKRARNIAAPANAQRFDIKTPVKRPENALTANPRTLSAASSLLQDTPDTRQDPCDTGK